MGRSASSLMFAIAVVLGCASCAWAAQPNSEGIWLERDSVHFKMAACPICRANPVFQDYLDHAYHASAWADIACKVTPESLRKELTHVGFEGVGVVNDETPMLGTLSAFGPKETGSDGVRIAPHILGTQNVIVQAYTGNWGNLQKAGEPAHLTLTTSVLPTASLEAPARATGAKGSTVDVLGNPGAFGSLLTMNEAASAIAKVHPQMILAVASSDPSVAKVEQTTFESDTAPDGNPYRGYRVRYIRAGHATISVTDALGANHEIALTVTDKTPPATALASASVVVKAKAYNGKAQKCAVPTVKVGGKTLRHKTDFTYSCKAGRAVGSYKVTITGQGAYAGTKTATFKIVPKGTSIAKLSKAKRAFTVKWKKLSRANLRQTTGYQVQWSTAKSMKGAKSKTVKATSAAGKKCTLKISKLKTGKRYYVQVRTFKKVGKTTYYSNWSKAKAVKTKK